MGVDRAMALGGRLGHAVAAQPAQPNGEVRVADGDRAAVTAGQGLGGVEREDRRLGQVRRAYAIALYLDPVGRVLDDGQLVGVGDRPQRRHVGELAVEVNGQDRSGPWPHGPLDRRRVDQTGLGLDVGQDGPRPGLEDRVGRRGEGHRRGDDLVAGPDVERAQGDQHAQRAAARSHHLGRHAGAVACQVVAELALEGGHLGHLASGTGCRAPGATTRPPRDRGRDGRTRRERSRDAQHAAVDTELGHGSLGVAQEPVLAQRVPATIVGV